MDIFATTPPFTKVFQHSHKRSVYFIGIHRLRPACGKAAMHVTGVGYTEALNGLDCKIFVLCGTTDDKRK